MRDVRQASVPGSLGSIFLLSPATIYSLSLTAIPPSSSTMSCCGDSSQGTYNNRITVPPPGTTTTQPVNTEKPAIALAPLPLQTQVAAAEVRVDPQHVGGGGIGVGIDFGTTFSGVSYASEKHFGEQTRMVLSWPGTDEHFRKIPTCLIYRAAYPGEKDEYGQPVVGFTVASWGLVAKRSAAGPNEYKCEWFKLYLTPDGQDAQNPSIVLPPGKTTQHVIVDFLKQLWRHASEQITQVTGSVSDLMGATVVLTVPSSWTAAGCQVMRDAALKVGMVRSTGTTDRDWRSRLHIITEPEAAAVHAAASIQHAVLFPPNNFILADAGGGTIDTASYKIVGSGRPVELAELTVRTGGNCGSLFIDVAFEKHLRTVLQDHPVHLDTASLRSFMHNFADVDKLAYNGSPEEDAGSFRYEVFNLEDDHDPAIGLDWGTLSIPGKVLKEEVFSPVVAQVLQVIKEQLDKNPTKRADAIILVGGFASSGYLFKMVQTTFAHRVGVFLRPQDCDVATVQGAARYALGIIRGRLSVMNVICPSNYMMQTKLQATPEDLQARPGYISTNKVGTQVCEKRLTYLASKNAIMRKYQRLESPFQHFAQNSSDSTFNAVLLISDEDTQHRYIDQTATKDFCRWTVDLADYPPFQDHFARGLGAGYINFILGLEFDSAEVRGTLLLPGVAGQPAQVCGRATFEYL
ncbi:hypothetical protein P7C70_g3743, partial [Phenoliferia sp. Uapishka_3]